MNPYGRGVWPARSMPIACLRPEPTAADEPTTHVAAGRVARRVAATWRMPLNRCCRRVAGAVSGYPSPVLQSIIRRSSAVALPMQWPVIPDYPSRRRGIGRFGLSASYPRRAGYPPVIRRCIGGLSHRDKVAANAPTGAAEGTYTDRVRGRGGPPSALSQLGLEVTPWRPSRRPTDRL